MNTLCEQLQQDLVVDAVEVLGDIALYEPACTGPYLLHFCKRSVTAATRAETVRALIELGFVVCVQDEADDLLE